MAIKKRKRDQSAPIPRKKIGQLTDAAVDLNDVHKRLDEIKRLAQVLRSGRINLADLREASWKLEVLANQGQADLAAVLLKLMHVGAEIRPTFTGDDHD